MDKVNRYTRAPHDGRVIYCPKCASENRVTTSYRMFTRAACSAIAARNTWKAAPCAMHGSSMMTVSAMANPTTKENSNEDHSH